eukprot:3933016-Rhodomonas_salina.1
MKSCGQGPIQWVHLNSAGVPGLLVLIGKTTVPPSTWVGILPGTRAGIHGWRSKNCYLAG